MNPSSPCPLLYFCSITNNFSILGHMCFEFLVCIPPILLSTSASSHCLLRQGNGCTVYVVRPIWTQICLLYVFTGHLLWPSLTPLTLIQTLTPFFIWLWQGHCNRIRSEIFKTTCLAVSTDNTHTECRWRGRDGLKKEF